VLVEGFDSRKADKGRQSEERGKTREPSHGPSIAIWGNACQ
jgi:hypothetical protein